MEVLQRGLQNVVNFFLRLLAPSPSDTLVSVTTLSFYIASLEMLLPLVSGARLVLASREEATDGALLSDLLSRSSATLF